MRECRICKGRATDRHHVFSGSYRYTSEEYGYVIDLCRLCHNRLHLNPLGEWLIIKQEFQIKFEKEVGGRQKFIRTFGRNYLE